MGLFETFDMLVRIAVWVKNSWEFFSYISCCNYLQVNLITLFHKMGGQDLATLLIIFNIKQKQLLSNEYFSTPTTSIDCL